MKYEIIEAIRKGNLFDFICENAYRIDKPTLVRLAKELAYVADPNKKDQLIENVVEFLDDDE